VAQIGHTGINIGNGLMIHSSSQGVTIKEWDTGWHATSFAFAKSVLP
jgi:cell wall-associated NlpC family hydrolase